MPKYIGIDIGKSSVKVAVVKTAYRKIAVDGLASVPVGEDLPAAIKAAVEQAVGGAGTGDGVATSVDGSKLVVRTLSVPASAQKQLGDVLPFEMEAQTPFDVSEGVLDYKVLSSSNKEKLSVLTVLARTEDVKARIDVIKAAIGVEPERVGAGPFPLAGLVEWISMLGVDGPICVVDLGAKSADFLALVKGEPVFARTLSMGTDGLPATASKLAREIRVSISAYRAQGGDAPEVVYLAGGGAFVSGAESFLAAELQLKVLRLPQVTVEMSERAQAMANDAPLYAKALALALPLAGRATGFDLRKGPLAYERGYGWLSERVPVLAGLGVALAASFVFSSCASYVAASKEHATLEAAMGMVSKDVLGEETTSVARVNELLVQQGAPDEDPMPHADAFDVMVRISEHIPQSMTHDIEELDVQKGHVVVHGVAGSTSDAKSVEASLKNEKCFSDVHVSRTNQVVGGERQKYVLEFDIKCPEDVKATKKKDSKAASSASATPSATGGK